jgi:hypothetical protein
MPIIRQTPGGKGIWGNCHFFVDDDTKECDWWVVFEGLDKKEKVKCPAGNTIFITGEPESIKKYNQKFINQFGYVITGRQDINHKNIIRDQQALPWMAGIKFINGQFEKQGKNYNWFKKNNNFKKKKIISVIISNKKNTPGHKKRLEFVYLLKKILGNNLDIFGLGIKTIADKKEALIPYKYHLAIENSSCDYYWTEKLSDAFLLNTYPFYYGCPNIHNYFSKKSLSYIDIKKTSSAINIIKKIINNNTYENSIQYTKRSKDLILNKYNLFPFICNILTNLRTKNNQLKINKIIPEKTFTSSLINKIIRIR